MNIIYIIGYTLSGLLVGALGGFAVGQRLGKKKGKLKKEHEMLEEAKRNADSEINRSKNIREQTEKEIKILKEKAEIEIKEKRVEEREKIEKEAQIKKNELNSLEKRIIQKEENINRQSNIIEKRIFEVKDKEKRLKLYDETLKERAKEIKEAEAAEISYLEKIASLSAEDAKKQLLEIMEREAQLDFTGKLKKFEEEFLKNANQKALDIISTAIEKSAVEYVNEGTVSAIELPNDEMKGRLIGREGRNIRTFETVTGVDLIIDDTPDFVTVSSFDPVRREVGKRVLEKLIADGRIHPKRIEEIHAKIEKEVNEDIIKTGEETVFEFGFSNINPEIVKLIGKLKFRTSYGQNALQHSKEVAYIAAHIAQELGIDVNFAKRGGLLHDIGKAIDREQEGNHQHLGADIAKKYNENPIIVNAILAHHGDVPYESLEASLVQIADAISASRPGARRETYQFYIKRVRMLEAIANAFTGVEKSFAIQAGRELRIIVDYQDISDDEARVLARNITKKIEQEAKFPGTIKIIVIRETRFVETAK